MNTGIFIEHDGKEFKKVSLEALGGASKIASEKGGKAFAFLFGEIEKPERLLLKGADKIYYFKGQNLYRPETFAKLIQEKIESENINLFICGSTINGRDLAARVCAKISASFGEDIVDFKIEGDKLRVKRPVFAGKAYVWEEFLKENVVIVVRPNVFQVVERGSEGDIEEESMEDVDRLKLLELKQKEEEEPDVTEADVIVSGGRGVGGPHGFEPLKKLARVLKAALGASRAAVDAGWIDHSYQVGQTGKTVSPSQCSILQE